MEPKTASTGSASRTGSGVTDRLEADVIRQGIDPSVQSYLGGLSVLSEVDSTNTELMRRAAEQQHAHAVIADRQLAGRGRRERKWHSPAGGNLYFSLGWRFESPGFSLSSLPLVAALAVAEALTETGLDGHGVKWPNDILVDGRKTCGILAEMKWTGNEALAVIGIGINVRMPRTQDEDPDVVIDRPWTDLESNLDEAHRPCDRNALASGLLERLLTLMPSFEKRGFEPFREEWKKWDLLQNGPVTLETDDGQITGVSAGVNEQGELLLEHDGGVSAFSAGEVRVFRGVKAF